MAAFLTPSAKQQFFDNAGAPAAGFKLYTFAAGTGNPQATYTDSAQSVANTNPIILDARGEAVIYLPQGVMFDYELRTAAEVEVWTREGVSTSVGDVSTLNFTQSGNDSLERTLQSKLSEFASILDYIPQAEHAAIRDYTSTYDCTEALNSACAEHRRVYAPQGGYKLTDKVQIGNYRKLYGDGRTMTRFLVGSDFNLAATAVFEMTGGEPGASIADLGIYFTQPDTAVRANLTAYPPAIKATSTPRFRVSNLRISKAMTGIDMTGNSGGAVIDGLEISSFVKGVAIDGSLDSVKINKLHFWVFDITTNQRTIYSDATNIAIDSGRCDDFSLTNSILFSVVNALHTFTGSLPGLEGGTFGNVSNVDFDDRGGLYAETGSLQISSCFFSLGRAGAQAIRVVDAFVSLSAIRTTVISGATLPAIELTGNGVISWNGGTANRSAVDLTMVKGNATGGTLIVNGVHFEQSLSGTFNQPVVDASSGTRVVFRGNNINGRGLGGTNYFLSATGNLPYVIEGNEFHNCSIQVPSTYTLNTSFGGNVTIGTSGAEEVSGTAGSLHLVGAIRYCYFEGALDGAGAATIAHGVSNAHQRLVSVQAWHRNGSGHAVPFSPLPTVSSANIALTGGTASARYRVVLGFTRYAQPSWT